VIESEGDSLRIAFKYCVKIANVNEDTLGSDMRLLKLGCDCRATFFDARVSRSEQPRCGRDSHYAMKFRRHTADDTDTIAPAVDARLRRQREINGANSAYNDERR